jgi:protein-S-isoprenylcysteine O-methyltransferase Ste14
VFDVFYFDVAGFFIGVAGLMLCRIAQSIMGKSWRVGIDAETESRLITNDIYKYIRNPTYTGLFMLFAGVWLIFPTVLFTIWIIVFFLLLEVQVRCEEEYLLQVHGEKHVQYSQGTKRYIPWLY